MRLLPLVVALFAFPIAAEEAAPAPQPAPPVATKESFSDRFLSRWPNHRWRIGAGYWFGGGDIGTFGNGGVGLTARGGVQLDNEWAGYVQFQLSTVSITGVTSLSAMIERTFAGLLSFGLGVGAAGTWRSGLFDATTHTTQGGWGLGIPLRVAFTLGPNDPDPTVRKRQRLFVGIDGWAGVVLSSTDSAASRFGWYGGFGVGYEMM